MVAIETSQKAAIENVIQSLNMYSFTAICFQAELEGKSIVPYLESISGLSRHKVKAMFNSDHSPKKLEKLRLDFIEGSLIQAREKGFSKGKLTQLQAVKESPQKGDSVCFQGLAGIFEIFSSFPIEKTKEFAILADSFLDQVKSAAKLNEISKLNEAIDTFNSAIGSTRSDDDKFDCWVTFSGKLDKIIDSLIFQLLAVFDVECGLHFFCAFEPRPMFLWCMPRLNPDVLENGRIRTKRKFKIYPIRRLLELCYVLAKYRENEQWCERLPGLSELSQALSRDAPTISNWFDGTKTLTIREFYSINNLFFTDGRHSINEENYPNLGCLYLVAKLFGMSLNFKNDATSEKYFQLLVDDRAYHQSWQFHRDRLFPNSKGGTLKWPDILTKQLCVPPGIIGSSG